MHLRPRFGREDGVTLLEVLIVVVILSVIVVPLTGAIVVFLRNTDRTIDRMAESHDAQIAAAYFAQDVQSVGVRDWSANPFSTKPSIELGVAQNAGLFPCGTATTPVLVRFAWDDPGVGTPSLRSVSYVVSVVGTERQLHRVSCDAAGSVTSDLILAHHVDGATAPVIACVDTAQNTVSCAAAALPATVRLTLTIQSPSNSSSYTVTLVGQRRQTT